MAKTIKFNLICDDYPVRTLEDLREHFCIEDILAYYQNGLLERWLSVREYSEELKKIQEIKTDDEIKIIKKIIRIFNLDIDSSEVLKSVYMLQYKRDNLKAVQNYEKENYKVNYIIEDYFRGYQKVIDKIIQNRTDLPCIKAAVNEINDKYMILFDIDYRILFTKLYHYAPLAIFVMLTFDDMREKYLSKNANYNPFFKAMYGLMKLKNISSDINNSEEEKMNQEFLLDLKEDFNIISSRISSVTVSNKLKEIMGENLKVFAGHTEGYWKDIEPDDKKYMILSMESGDYVRSAGKSGEELGYDDIQDKFVILDGIDYKSNNSTHELLYMEV